MSPKEFEKKYRRPDIYDFMNENCVGIVLALEIRNELLVTGPFPAKKCKASGQITYTAENPKGAKITNRIPLEDVLKGESGDRLIRCLPLQ